MKAVVAAFNQEKALVGAFSVITNLRMDLFEALAHMQQDAWTPVQAGTRAFVRLQSFQSQLSTEHHKEKLLITAKLTPDKMG